MTDQLIAPSFTERFLKAAAEAGLGGPIMETIAQKVLAELDFARIADEHQQLVAKLHKAQRHPDYEYETTESPRKSGDSKRPEEGEGWEPNNYACDGRNWERGDYTETEYWMRTKAAAANDNRDPFKLPPITLPKVELSAYLEILRARINKGYMPSSVKEGFNSKPEYCSPVEFLNLHHGSGYYCLYDDFDARWPTDAFTCGEITLDRSVSDADRSIWFALDEDQLQHGGLAIFTNLKTAETYVRVPRKNGKPGDWVRWHDWQKLTLNESAIKTAVDIYG